MIREFKTLGVTAAVTSTQCIAYGFAATVNMNGCDYTFHDTAVNHEKKSRSTVRPATASKLARLMLKTIP